MVKRLTSDLDWAKASKAISRPTSRPTGQCLLLSSPGASDDGHPVAL